MTVPLFLSYWLFISFVSASQSDTDAGIGWFPFTEGMEKAASQGKYVFLDFYADWCTYCHLLDNTTLRDSSVVRELEDNFVSIKVNTESKEVIRWQGKPTTYSEFSTSMGVMGLPTLMFLNHKSEVIGSYPYFADENMMLKLLTYISSGSRGRNESFQEFLSQYKQ
ncbi:thioredoxin family protein [Fibrobacterota bacterium]